MMTRSQIEEAVRAFLQTNEPSFDAQLPLFIRMAEEKVLKQAQLTLFQRNATSNAFPGVRFMPYPLDFLAPMSYSITVGEERRYILLKETSFVQAVEADGSVTGAPLYYSLYDEKNFLFGPTPDQPYPLELQYLYRPPSLMEQEPDGTTWLSINAPLTLLYGALVQAYTFQKGEADLMQVYMAQYQDALAGLKMLGEAKQTTERYRVDQLRRPKE